MTGARYTLWLLMAVYTFSILDRQIISILAEDIKADLGLSDTQLGLLTGLAFALFYATLGIPIARLAERRSRTLIIAVCLTLWSVMTVAAGMARSFAHLALARIGVGVGEAGAMPASHSLIADRFAPEERSSAMAVFQLGVPAGVLFGFLIGGWVNAWLGWRETLIVVGVPGIVLAAIVYLTVKEPARRTAAALESTFFADLKRLWSIPTYRYLTAASTFASMGGYAVLSWTPPLLLREYELTTAVVGTALALLNGIIGGLGTFGGGALGDRAARRDPKGPFKVAALATVLSGPLFLMAFLATSYVMTLVFLGCAFLFYLSWMGPHWAMVQSVAPQGTRATASAFILFILNLVGLGLGPLGIGIISDAFAAAGLDAPLRSAMIVGTITFPLSALFFYLAGRSYAENPVSDTAARKGEGQPISAH
ncbi:MAG: MFS transporter [Pseudomonadota bacterium]